MHDQRRAVLDRVAEVGRRRSVVHDERYARVVGDGADGVEVGNVPARVGNRLAEDRTRVVIDRGFDGVNIIEVDEFAFPSKAFEHVLELGVGAAVEARRCDNVHARHHQRIERHDLCGVTRGTANSAGTTFKMGDTLGQRHNRRVRQPRIDKADFLKVEEPRGMIRVLKYERG